MVSVGSSADARTVTTSKHEKATETRGLDCIAGKERRAGVPRLTRGRPNRREEFCNFCHGGEFFRHGFC